jgi:HEAT repeat protein
MRTALRVFLAMLLLTYSIGLVNADQLRPLINDLKSTDTEAALKALKRLGQSGDIRAVPPVIDALHDERDVVRQYAVEALQHLIRSLDGGYIAVKRWLRALIKRLQPDPPGGVVTAAQESLDLYAQKA